MLAYSQNLPPNLNLSNLHLNVFPRRFYCFSSPSLCTSLQSEAPIKVREEQPKFIFNCCCSNPIFLDLSSLAATDHSFPDPFYALDFWVILHFRLPNCLSFPCRFFFFLARYLSLAWPTIFEHSVFMALKFVSHTVSLDIKSHIAVHLRYL